MLADDFVSVVAFDALRAPVPGEDVAVRVELKNRVIDNRIDQLAKAGLALIKTFAGPKTFGYIAGDLGVTDEVAFIVEDGVQNGHRPKERPVLANTPALLLPAAVRGGCLESGVGKTCPSILLGKESCIWLPDNFRRAIPLQPLRAGVPGSDAPLRTDQIDGVIDNSINQKLKAPRIIQRLNASERHVCNPTSKVTLDRQPATQVSVPHAGRLAGQTDE